ncbi:MAG: FtsX-like permease family protein [Chitinophagaceae bacterium]|nr:FtsX-like permease family protein [Chitinophagaceae bacterium]
MNFLFAWRYFRSKKSTNAINIIAWIAVTAIAVGTAALIIILSVFNGFESLVKSLYGDFYPSIKIIPATGKVQAVSKENLQALGKINGIAAFSAIVEEKALLTGNAQTIVTIRGVDANYLAINPLAKYIQHGKFETGTAQEPQLIMGAGVENAAAIDFISGARNTVVYFPNKNSSSLLQSDGLNAFNIVPSGTFVIQQDFDNKYAFTNINFMRYMLDLKPDEVTAVEVKTNVKEASIKPAIEKIFGKKWIVETRYEQNQSLYAVMQMEKWVIYGILCLILVVAAFNMIGAITMLVLEKQRDIAVLKALGATNQKVRNIFLSTGMLLATIGSSVGLVFAGIICWLQYQYHLIKLGGSTFIIDYYPVDLSVFDFVLVAITVIAISYIAAWFSARKAALTGYSLRSTN